jgi:hypothetical protein
MSEIVKNSDNLKSAILWNSIKNVTKSDITHAGISLSADLKEGYSYSFNYHSKSLKNDESFHVENLEKLSFDHARPLLVYAALINNESYEKLSKYIESHKQNASKTRYDFQAIFNRLFHRKKDTVDDSDFKWVCSTFTNACLHKAGINVASLKNNPSPATLARNINSCSNFTCVYFGKPTNYNGNTAENKLIELINIDAMDYANDKIIGKELTAAQISENGKIIRNYILFNNKQPETIDELTPEAWKNLLEYVGNDGYMEDVRKTLKELINNIKDASIFLKKNIDNLSNKIENMTNNITMDTVDSSDQLNYYRHKLELNKTLLISVNQINKEYCQVISDKVIKDFFRINYTLYRDTISVYNTYYKSKSVKESYVDTTINDINDLISFDIPQYC